MGERPVIQLEAEEIFDKLEALGLKQRALAGALGIEENKVTKVKSGVRRFTATEVSKAFAWLKDVERQGGYAPEPDLPDSAAGRDYLPVDVLPSYAGMGGGGTGEGDLETALVPRRLVEDELHAKPADLLLIEARGTSMQPDFEHGDQILIDRRDTNTAQPGAFALWDGDAYVIKMLERIPQTGGQRFRIFSRDKDLSAFEVNADDVQIMGRPVWFGRRL